MYTKKRKYSRIRLSSITDIEIRIVGRRKRKVLKKRSCGVIDIYTRSLPLFFHTLIFQIVTGVPILVSLKNESAPEIPIETFRDQFKSSGLKIRVPLEITYTFKREKKKIS